MAPITFGLVGSGWRAAFFLRVAAALPDRFRCGGAVVRDAEKGRRFEEEWDIPTFRTLDALLRGGSLAFVVLSVPRAVAPSLLHDLAARRMPVLTETPRPSTSMACSRSGTSSHTGHVSRSPSNI